MPYLTENQWQKLSPIFTDRPPAVGRPLRDDRPILEGIIHVILNNLAWMDLPETYPPFSTVFRRYNAWVKNGIWEQVLDTLFMDLFDRTGYNLWRVWGSGRLLVNTTSGPALDLTDELNEAENIYVILLFLRGIVHQKQDESMRRVKS